MKRILATLALILLAATAAARRRPIQTPDAPCPRPAARVMKYALLPDLMDTTPGNAADHYRRAVQNWRKEGPPDSRCRSRRTNHGFMCR